MKVKCINDCEGDFFDITVDKEYEVIEHITDFLMYVIDGKKITEERYMIKDDISCIYPYPVTCFETIKINVNPKYKFVGGNAYVNNRC